MHPEIKTAQREIIEAFNSKPKNGIQKIQEICLAKNIPLVEKQIADFFHQQKQNLDLESVGDYLSGPDAENQKVLKAFTAQIDLAGQSFIEGLRSFLKTFKLPGEAQKIDRLVESFSTAYCQQNPGGDIANKDAGYLLAFQTIMLNTDLHNPNIAAKNKMTLDGLKKNLRGCNNGESFNEDFLQKVYENIKNKPFELNFIKTNPGYEINSALNKDATFKKLNLLLQSPKLAFQDIFPGISDKVKASVDKPKSWLNSWTGYEGTITLTNEETQENLATIQVYKPGFLSKWVFGEQPKVIIQPLYQSEQTALEAIDLTAKIAASFQSSVTSITATYDYLKSDLQNAYTQQQNPLIKSSSNPYRWWSKETEEEKVEEILIDELSVLKNSSPTIEI